MWGKSQKYADRKLRVNKHWSGWIDACKRKARSSEVPCSAFIAVLNVLLHELQLCAARCSSSLGLASSAASSAGQSALNVLVVRRYFHAGWNGSAWVGMSLHFRLDLPKEVQLSVLMCWILPIQAEQRRSRRCRSGKPPEVSSVKFLHVRTVRQLAAMG